MKKITIKKLLIAVAIATATNISFAQTPYDSFAPSSEKKEMLALPDMKFRAINSDTLDIIRYIELDKEEFTIAYYDVNDSLVNIFYLRPLEYKWWAVDPMAHKYPHLSPYDFVGGNPINRVDPNGADWYKDKNGNIQWHNSSGTFGEQYSLKGLEGTWTNIGTEFLEFNGKQLTYYWQTTNKQGDLIVNSLSFSAVSGKPLDEGSYADYNGYLTYEPSPTYTFNYSATRQRKENIGPTPEGLYSINKSPFVANKNESGYQTFNDMSWHRQIRANMGLGTNWPGGQSSWGDFRWKLNFENVSTDRNNFYLHGGYTWGSRGCIDLGCGINSFYTSFMSTDYGNPKVYLKVTYDKDLQYTIQNQSTVHPIQYVK